MRRSNRVLITGGRGGVDASPFLPYSLLKGPGRERRVVKRILQVQNEIGTSYPSKVGEQIRQIISTIGFEGENPKGPKHTEAGGKVAR